SASAATFSPDGRLVVVNDHEGGRLTFVDVDRGRVLRDVELERGLVTPVAFSPDGSRAVAVTYGSSQQNTLVVIDVASGRIVAEQKTAGFPNGFAYVDHGRRIATFSLTPAATTTGALATSILELWDATTLDPIGGPITLESSGPLFASTSPGGGRV